MMYLFRLIMAVVSDYNRGTDAVKCSHKILNVRAPDSLPSWIDASPSVRLGFFME